MPGILIFTASREDAYEDFKRSVEKGHPLSEIEPYLPDAEFDEIGDLYDDDDRAHLWGTTAGPKWNQVERGDVALVYRDGSYIAQGQVVYNTQNLDLAREIWDREGNPWDPDNPWEYLTFLTDIEDIDVDAEAFNELVNYDSSYRPQGFTRVADHRIESLLEEKESVETAIATLTGAGEKKHRIEEEDTTDEFEQFLDDLEEASKDGARSKEFEQLVAKAFTRLGFEASWIEGGDDTDVEITAPVHAIVETKSRGNTSGVQQLPATRIDSHRKQRGADHGFVVGRHFPPSSRTDAEEVGLTTITAEKLGELVQLRRRYGIPPEIVADSLDQAGPFQDDRLDELREYVRESVEAMEILLDVIRAFAKRSGPVDGASDIRMILIGIYDGIDEVPNVPQIERAIELLQFPAVGLVRESDGKYELVTGYDDAVTRLRALSSILEDVVDE